MLKPPVRLFVIAAALLLCMAGMMVQLMSVIRGDQIAEAGVRQGKYLLHVPLSTGMIYDCNFEPLNNTEDAILAVVNPTPDTLASVFTKLRDREQVTEQLQSISPFVCFLNEDAESSQNLIVLHGKQKDSGSQLAQHLLGYRQNGEAKSGLELSYASWLTSCDASVDVTFTVSALGEVLAGAESSVVRNGRQGGGLVTTIDRRIQQIAEDAMQQMQPHAGAIVVMECGTGRIAACASTPVYDPDDLAESLDSDNAPFLNRALSAYSVGSVFKLVTAATALEQGFSAKYMYDCGGSISVYGQYFRCHQWDGHGRMDMQQAMINSCNPYFISLSRLLTPEAMHDTAEALGFGREIVLADGLVSDSGYLQSVSDLQIEAEKANMSFGQGKLLATPLQIAAMTACIADDGIYTQPQLVLGLTQDGETMLTETKSSQRRVLESATAAKLRRMMTAVIERSKQTNGKPSNTRAAGKTSTAQTGQYDQDGTELCHAWMTGFFPVNKPKYAVTVFVENGGSGNGAAAPVFREIIEQITDEVL